MKTITDKDGNQWVLVPVEVTDEMYVIGQAHMHYGPMTVYEQMCGAAPEPPIDLEQVAKDAARYRWLRSLPVKVPACGVEVVFWEDESGEAIRGDELNAAIDTAMKEQP